MKKHFKTCAPLSALGLATLALATLGTTLAPQAATAAEAKLNFVRSSKIRNPWGSFPGIPGGSSYGNDPACESMGGINGMKLTADIPRTHQDTKRRLQRVSQTTT